MLNQLNSTTKRELDAKYLSKASAEEIEEDVSDLQETVSGIQSDLGELTNKVNVYLDTEQEVGRFGDEPLYQIVINCGTLPNATSKVVTTDIIAENILRYDVFATRSFESGDYKKQIITIPNGYVGGGDVTTVAYIDSNDKISISLSAGSDRTMFTGLAIVQYTKPTPAPEPDNTNDSNDSDSSNDSNESQTEPTQP